MKQRLAISVTLAGLIYTLAQVGEKLPQDSLAWEIVQFTIILLCGFLVVSIVSSPSWVQTQVRRAVEGIVDMATPKYSCPRWVERRLQMACVVSYGALVSIALITGLLYSALVLIAHSETGIASSTLLGGAASAIAMFCVGVVGSIDALNMILSPRQPGNN